MPYKFETDKLKIPKKLDRRRKLSDQDKKRIVKLYNVDKLGIREIARKYEDKCTRRNIQFILFPERLKTVNYSGHWKKYYDKEKHRLYIKDHRNYKKSLCLK